MHYYELEQIGKQQSREKMHNAEQWRLLHPFPQPLWLIRQIRQFLRPPIGMGRRPQQTGRRQHKHLIP